MTLTEYLKSIADAIRAKNGATGTINAQDFASEILALGPIYGTLEITENDLYDVKAFEKVSVMVPNGDTAIGLIQRDVTEYKIPYGTKSIASSVFKDNTTIKEIIIPETVEQTGTHSFSGCTSLETAHLPNSLKSLGGNSFNGCSKLMGIVLPNGLNSIGEYCFKDCFYNDESLTITIPESVTHIGDGAFQGSNIRSVVILGSIKEIPSNCFKSAIRLSNVIIPDSVTKIGSYAFAFCEASLTDIPIMNSVTEIGDYAFQNCRKFTEITIPPCVNAIGSNVFNGCNQLKKVTFNDGITTIGQGAFQGSALEEIDIPRTVSVLEPNCFWANIKTFFVPSNVTEIKSLALGSNVSGYNVVMESETPCTVNSPFITSNLGKIYVPKGMSTIYKTASGWTQYANYIYEFTNITFHVDPDVLNNENYLYSTDNGETWVQFTSTQFTLDNVHVLRFKSTNADQTLLIGSTVGGSDIATIANAEATYATPSDTTIYITLGDA